MNNPTPNQAQMPDWRRMLTARERAAMLQDIASVSLAAGTRLFPEQPWADFGVTPEAAAAPKSPVEQLGFVEHLLPQLSRAVSPNLAVAAHFCRRLYPAGPA